MAIHIMSGQAVYWAFGRYEDSQDASDPNEVYKSKHLQLKLLVRGDTKEHRYYSHLPIIKRGFGCWRAWRCIVRVPMSKSSARRTQRLGKSPLTAEPGQPVTSWWWRRRHQADSFLLGLLTWPT